MSFSAPGSERGSPWEDGSFSANAIAGEWGHKPVPWPAPDEIPAPPCYRGQLGCIETFLSGPALAVDHRRHGGRSLGAAEIAAFAARGDAECGATLGRYMDRLARGLASVINLIDPDAIVLGAAIPAYRRYTSGFPSCGGSTPSLMMSLLACFVHGDSSGVRGAAWLWRPGEEV